RIGGDLGDREGQGRPRPPQGSAPGAPGHSVTAQAAVIAMRRMAPPVPGNPPGTVSSTSSPGLVERPRSGGGYPVHRLSALDRPPPMALLGRSRLRRGASGG